MDKDQQIQEWLDGKNPQEPKEDQDLAYYKLLYKNLASPNTIDIPPYLAERVLMQIESQATTSQIIIRWVKIGGLVLGSGLLALLSGYLGISFIPEQTNTLLPYAGPLLFMVILFLLIEMADQLWVKKVHFV